MASEIDLHLGRRLRRRRRLLGLTQQQVAEAVGIRFQQVQKYECGANRVSASRLWELAEALEAPVNYFFDGLERAARREPVANDRTPTSAPPPRPAFNAPDAPRDGEVLARKETLDLVRAYYQLGERPRRRLLDLAKSLNGDNDAA
jgi:transcriptional regulator with XRE-family HTH domain